MRSEQSVSSRLSDHKISDLLDIVLGAICEHGPEDGGPLADERQEAKEALAELVLRAYRGESSR